MIPPSVARGIVLCVLAAVAAAASLGAQPTLEYNVKAALLLDFARFIEWPAGAFRDANAPIDVCVLGTNPFGDALERATQGETIDNRPIAARLVKGRADSAGCHLLFVPAGTESRAREMLQQAVAHAVTVGESRRFEDMGGAVTLVIDGGRVGFTVNLRPVEERGIRISARMLQLARRVDRATPEK